MVDQLKFKLTPGQTLFDISKGSDRYVLYKVGPVISVSVSKGDYSLNWKKCTCKSEWVIVAYMWSFTFSLRPIPLLFPGSWKLLCETYSINFYNWSVIHFMWKVSCWAPRFYAEPQGMCSSKIVILGIPVSTCIKNAQFCLLFGRLLMERKQIFLKIIYCLV